jgi:hypothetical protein
VSNTLAVNLKQQITICVRSTAAAAAGCGQPYNIAAVLDMMLPKMQAAVQEAHRRTSEYNAAAAAAMTQLASSFLVQVTADAAACAEKAMSEVIREYIEQCSAAHAPGRAAAAAAAAAAANVPGSVASAGGGTSGQAAAAASAAVLATTSDG